jgi:hypothetical protein
MRVFVFWWAHQDLNLGPKDYENREPNKTIMISMTWSNALNQIAVLNDCSKELNEFNRLIFAINQVSIKLCI